MVQAARLVASQLVRRCNFGDAGFTTTTELETVGNPLGQGRAVDALHFGIRMQHEGYNLYLLGSEGLGKLRLAREMLEQEAKGRPVPDDFCYVDNFADAQKPQLLRVPSGRGQQLKREMAQVVEDLLAALPGAFQTDEYRSRAQELDEELKEIQEKAFNELGERARQQNIAIMSTPGGYTLAPLRDGALISPEEYEKLPKEEQADIDATIEEIRKDLRDVMRQVPILQRERRQRLKALNEEVSTATVGQIFNGMAKQFADLPQVLAYIEAMRHDVIENVEAFFNGEEESPDQHSLKKRAEEMTRYSINVLVDNADTKGAPVIYEDNPTFLDLIGRVEHIVEMGTLITDFTLIKPGALHRANGGYLLLDARKVLSNPFAYDGLKRALASREIRIQTLEQMLSLASTLSLEPEPIPLDSKVVLVGDRLLYYLLKEYDPEFGLMFKVAADFAEELPRNPDNTLLYARLIASLQQQAGLRPLNQAAVGAVIDECSRRAEDSEKISLDMESLGDLLREADYCAARNAETLIRADDVRKAIHQQEYRQSQWREQMQESMLRDIHLVDTTGSRVGQVNGLSVIQLGDYAFGHPSRITATVRLGDGKVIDIEREAKLGGHLHSKGVMILSACLANRYARERPLPIAASLVFEQSYGMVDGDSASTAELCVLLSALGQIPLRQDLAVTGSINQHGEVQAIGGVNQKIEGFFALCQARGLGGTQGVIIPHANIAHLMLREDVVAAVEAGRFAVYAARNVDEVLELLSGLPPARCNTLIDAQVEKLWGLHKQYQGGKDNAESGKSSI